MQILDLPLTDIIACLQSPVPFRMARYGDGEFQCMMKQVGQNCDGVRYSRAMSTELHTSLHNPLIVHCVSHIAARYGFIDRWLADEQIEIDWYDTDAILNASDAGELLPFVQMLQARTIVQVGPAHLRRLQAFARTFVECPDRAAFESIDWLQTEIQRAVKQTSASTVIISAGPAATVLVSRLSRVLPDADLIDIGSVWDPYVGVFSRSGHKRRANQWPELARLNGIEYEPRTSSR